MDSFNADLHNAIAQVCPIVSVAIVPDDQGDTSDRTRWRIDFDPSATPAQKAQARAVLTSFTSPGPKTPADEVEDKFTNDRVLRALAAVLINRLGITKAQFLALLRSAAD